ncbi:MAG: FeoB-associated Cys-rich membrane protein [Phascolarctobacterium faecium]
MWLAKANLSKLNLWCNKASAAEAVMAQRERSRCKMADYIIGGILVALAILAAQRLQKTSSGGCAGCSGCNGCGPSCHGQDRKLPPNKRWNGRRLRRRSLADY